MNGNGSEPAIDLALVQLIRLLARHAASEWAEGGTRSRSRGATSHSFGEAVMTDGTEYLRAADIALLTGVSIRTIRRWIADEIIPSTKLGGARLVARADLERRLYSFPDKAEEADAVPT